MQIYESMNKIIDEIGAVSKDQKNTSQGYSFRGIDQFQNALHPLLAKFGVVIVPQVLERHQEIVQVDRPNQSPRIDKHVSLKVKYDFVAKDGSKIETVVYGEGVDSGDKATNKAMSAAMKYCLIQTFCIPTQDQVDSDSTQNITIVTGEQDGSDQKEPEQKQVQFKPGEKPECCGKSMMISKYVDQNFGHAPFYCMTCKKKVAAQ